MSLFGKILSKLGLGGGAAATTPTPAPTPTPSPTPMAEAPIGTAPTQPIAVVDVEAQLEERAKTSGQKLNWRTSIVDLLKLLDIDSSYSARKELAAELDCPADKMADSAQMNMWLHKTVLARIAANGGTVPADLLD